METQNTLRETLAEAITSVETAPVETPAVEVKSEDKPTESRDRDESGRFSAKKEEVKPETQESAPVIKAPEEKPRTRPSTWKKDYWDKFDALDPDLQGYINQRETEYKTGVSTYRAEAENARQLNEAIAPFMPALQQHNIEPTQWIRNLGNAHQTLALGSPSQKLHMFQQLARDYGVDLSGVAYSEPPQVDPNSQWLMQQVQTLSQDLNSFKFQKEQAEQTAMQNEIQQFAATAPHFEMVKETMAGLLQAGLAQDLKTAYDKAVRLSDEAWQAEQDRLSSQSTQQQIAVAQKAKANAISPKSSTPSGTAKGSEGKGLREQIAAQMDAAFARV